jgi:hypothetical protein
MCSLAAVRTNIVGPAGSLVLDCLAKHLTNGTIQTTQLVGAQAVGLAQGMKSRLEQSLVHVYVSQASNEALIEQQWLDHPSTALEESNEVL